MMPTDKFRGSAFTEKFPADVAGKDANIIVV